MAVSSEARDSISWARVALPNAKFFHAAGFFGNDVQMF
jgi:hypothetical protein